MKLLCCVWALSTFAPACVTANASSAHGPMNLKQNAIAVRINAKGQIITIENRLTNVTHGVTHDGGRVETYRGTIDLATLRMALVSRSANSRTFSTSALGLKITRAYTLLPGRAYFDRKLWIRNESDQPIVLSNVTDCALRFAAPFASAAYHDDNMDQNDPGNQGSTETEQPVVYQTSVNVFMRGSKGGLLAGLKYPYFKSTLSNDSISLAYETNYRLKPGETLELPPMFCGVYKNTGYTCRKELSWKPRILSTKQEEMDLGEVRAMQSVIRDYLPMEPCPKPGYFTWLNSYWAYESMGGEGLGKTDAAGAKASCHLADLIIKSKCIDMMSTAPVWCGWAQYINLCPEIDAVGEDAIFPHNEHIDKVMSYAKSLNLPVSGFCEPNSGARHYRKDRPDWRVKPWADSPATLVANCHANDAYEDWFYRLQCNTIDMCGLSGWAWDHCWVRKPLICYGTTHGHEPGNCDFQQYRNVTRLIKRMRQRYPKSFLEIYWGLKEAGPWSLRGLNSLENAYENGAPCPPGCTIADDLRFQHWFNHNYRFIPTYMNMAQINLRREANGNLYAVLSCLNASTHASLCDWIPFETEAEADKIFDNMRYWKTWATDHLAYLEDRVDLFGMPCRKGGIDGTAHIIDDRGFIFVFNPTAGVCHGSVPLDELIGLTRGSRYSIDEISTRSPIRLGVYKQGDEMRFAIQPKTALLFELKPSREAIRRAEIPPSAMVQPAFRR